MESDVEVGWIVAAADEERHYVAGFEGAGVEDSDDGFPGLGDAPEEVGADFLEGAAPIGGFGAGPGRGMLVFAFSQ